MNASRPVSQFFMANHAYTTAAYTSSRTVSQPLPRQQVYRLLICTQVVGLHKDAWMDVAMQSSSPNISVGYMLCIELNRRETASLRINEMVLSFSLTTQCLAVNAVAECCCFSLGMIEQSLRSSRTTSPCERTIALNLSAMASLDYLAR